MSLRTSASTAASAGPNFPASTTRRTTSTSVSVAVTARLSERLSAATCWVWKPGVSTKTNCEAPRVRMPVMRCRVVCALLDVMLIFCPTRALSSVDLPTLGRPTMATRPHRCGSAPIGSSIRSAADCRLVAGAQGVEHAARRLLLGHAARAAFARLDQVQRRHHALDLEGLRMRLAARRTDAVGRHRQAARLQPFLQLGLGVLGPARDVGGLDDLAEQALHERARGLQAAVEEGGADQRLERVGQDRGAQGCRRRALRLRRAGANRASRVAGRRDAGCLRERGGRARVRSPSSESPRRSNSRLETTRLSTASPRNSSRSLWSAPKLRWVSARCRRAGSPNRWPMRCCNATRGESMQEECARFLIAPPGLVRAALELDQKIHRLQELDFLVVREGHDDLLVLLRDGEILGR